MQETHSPWNSQKNEKLREIRSWVRQLMCSREAAVGGIPHPHVSLAVRMKLFNFSVVTLSSPSRTVNPEGWLRPTAGHVPLLHGKARGAWQLWLLSVCPGEV